MFNFNTNTIVDRKFKFTELNRQIEASKECKAEEQLIESITLKNSISPRTLNSKEDKDIKEFYVFEVVMKERYIPSIFIKELDKAIKIPTLFIIKHLDYECGCITYKKDKTNKYYSTNWEKDPKYDIPLGSGVADTYKFVLSKFLKYPYLDNETIDEYYKRNIGLGKLDMQIDKMRNMAYKEQQSRKKFEYNEKLKNYIKQKQDLLKEEN